MKTSFQTVLPAFTLTLLLNACGGGSGGTSTGSQLTANQTKMIAGLVNRQTGYYNDLKAQTNSLKSATSSYCSAPSASGLTTLRNQWKSAFSSWMKAQWIFQGPVDTNDQFQRIEAWPTADASRVKSAIDQVVVVAPADITEFYIANRPVQAQGFPAMEYLLFSDDIFSDDIATINPRQCDILKAISANLATMSSRIDSDWVSYANDIKNPSSEVEFVDLTESINFLANQFLNLLITMKDRKLGDPLGFDKATGALDSPDIEAGEAWVSRQSLPAVLANFQALQALYKDEGGFGIDDFLVSLNKEAVSQDIDAKLAGLISTTQGLIDAGVTLHDNATDTRLQALQRATRALEVAVQDDMFSGIGASATFNFNDGD